MLGVKRPARTAAALVAGGVGLAIFAEGVFPHSHPEAVLQAVVAGPYGIDAALTGGTEKLLTQVRGPDLQVVMAWRGMPTSERWLGGTLLWAGLGIVGLWAALLRHKET